MAAIGVTNCTTIISASLCAKVPAVFVVADIFNPPKQ
jgi:hypothetical protein